MPPNTDQPSRISLERIKNASAVIDPVFLNTLQFECESLSGELGSRVVIKVETVNPIRSFKGRGACLYMSTVPAGSEVICASAGNFGQAMAYAARARGVRVTVYAAHNASPLKLDRMKALGASVILSGHDFDAARSEARTAAAERGARLVADAWISKR